MDDLLIDPPQAHRLIRTKLFVPRVHPDLVDRPRLVHRFRAGSHAKLTLVTAPRAGYGKTTLPAKRVEPGCQPPGCRRMSEITILPAFGCNSLRTYRIFSGDQ